MHQLLAEHVSRSHRLCFAGGVEIIGKPPKKKGLTAVATERLRPERCNELLAGHLHYSAGHHDEEVDRLIHAVGVLDEEIAGNLRVHKSLSKPAWGHHGIALRCIAIKEQSNKKSSLTEFVHVVVLHEIDGVPDVALAEPKLLLGISAVNDTSSLVMKRDYVQLKQTIAFVLDRQSAFAPPHTRRCIQRYQHV